MSLKGNLKEFSLADIFQLLDLSKKTGTLYVDDSEKENRVFFREGKIFLVTSEGQEELGNQLVKSGKLTEGRLISVFETQQSSEGRKKLAEILIEKDFIQPDVLKAFMEERIQDAIFDLFTLNQGEFCFEMDNVSETQEEDIGLFLNVKKVIAEAKQRLEEWEIIKEKIPSFQSILGMSPGPLDKKREIVLKPEEWQVLRFVDGKRPLKEIAESAGLSKFHTGKLLYNLLLAELLEVAKGEKEEKEAKEREETGGAKEEELSLEEGGPFSFEREKIEEQKKSEAELEKVELKTPKEDIVEIIEEESKGEEAVEEGEKGEAMAVTEIEELSEEAEIEKESLERLTEFEKKMKKRERKEPEKKEEEVISHQSNLEVKKDKNIDSNINSVSYALKELSRLAQEHPENSTSPHQEREKKPFSSSLEKEEKEEDKQEKKPTNDPKISKNLISKIAQGLKHLQ